MLPFSGKVFPMMRQWIELDFRASYFVIAQRIVSLVAKTGIHLWMAGFVRMGLAPDEKSLVRALPGCAPLIG